MTIPDSQTVGLEPLWLMGGDFPPGPFGVGTRFTLWGHGDSPRHFIWTGLSLGKARDTLAFVDTGFLPLMGWGEVILSHGP